MNEHIRARFSTVPFEPHTGQMTATQASNLKHDIEMAAFHLWLGVHGTGQGASKWMSDAGLDESINFLLKTIHERGN